MAVFSRRTPESDLQHDRLAAGLQWRGHEVIHVDIAAFVRGDASFDPHEGGGVVGNVAVRPAELDAVVLGPLPAQVAWTAPQGTRLSAEEHLARARAQGERHALAWSMVLELERRGVPVLSSPSRARPYDFKPFQLATLLPELPVPRTLITSHDDAARAFVDVVGEAIVKPVSGGPARLYEASPLRGTVPTIVQERVRGQDLRAVVVGDEVVCVGTWDGGDDDTVVDVRERDSFEGGAGRWLPVDAPNIASVARRAAALCHYDFAAVDLKQRPDGSVVVLEVNRTPVVVDLEEDLQAPITTRFVDLVERRAAARPGDAHR